MDVECIFRRTPYSEIIFGAVALTFQATVLVLLCISGAIKENIPFVLFFFFFSITFIFSFCYSNSIHYCAENRTLWTERDLFGLIYFRSKKIVVSDYIYFYATENRNQVLGYLFNVYKGDFNLGCLGGRTFSAQRKDTLANLEKLTEKLGVPNHGIL
ncbi:hypothetical protein [Andreprevotia chitinilytica]|uniref:hypothetical protein n=1 Tax=Andreprevotia chitinilytica TaxID=396808 RepID=UPI00054F234E|nr:hypothetical protein [Andreprevotia chitinilytica]